MKTGLTTHSLANKDFREQLYSMLQQGIKPDFIILHYSGRYRFSKALGFIKRVLKQYQLKSLSYIVSRNKGGTVPAPIYKLSAEAEKEVDTFLSLVKIIPANGINSASTIALIKGLGYAIIACNSGKLNAAVLNLSNAIFLNVHASKLPAYRGMNNVEWTLWENQDIYGTLHRISKGIDEGDILLQEKIETPNFQTIAEYRAYSFFKSNELMGKAVKGYLDKKLSFAKQEISGKPIDQYYVMHPILKEYLAKKLAGR
jgi:folate-dependent phosphoribosylglycinamide formyltransferase PurN